VTGRIRAILSRLKEVFRTGTSMATLYKYTSLWHPSYDVPPDPSEEGGVIRSEAYGEGDYTTSLIRCALLLLPPTASREDVVKEDSLLNFTSALFLYLLIDSSFLWNDSGGKRLEGDKKCLSPSSASGRFVTVALWARIGTRRVGDRRIRRVIDRLPGGRFRGVPP
jgi:hypothetical protein